MNFAAVAVLLVLLQPVLKPLAFRPFVWLGQASLQVFCVHLLFVFAGLTLLGNASMLSSAKQAALLTVTFTAMLVTAKLFSKTEAKQERQPKAKPSDGVPPSPKPSIEVEPLQSPLSSVTTPLPAPAPCD
jgi:peptidoglycan/LPS O-acetylase OafA/YrhL